MQNTKKYSIIYCDPPWSYRNKKVFGKFHNKDGYVDGGCLSKYDTLSLSELKEIPIKDIADKACALFLWATTPLLPEALEVMEAWGFSYKTSLYWRKIMSLGMGYWYRGQVEQLLLGVKGKLKAFHIQRANIIQTKVHSHSQKPDEFYELIEMTALEPKIELFARNKREGWDCWGNEVESDIVL